MKSKKVYCIYHSADFDGIGSAAILNYFYSDKNEYKVVNVPFNYGQDLPDYESWDKDALVFMMDVSWDKDDYVHMKNLLNTYSDNFVFIDHHSIVMNDLKDRQIEIKGLLDNSHCAAVLVWKWFFPDEKLPNVLVEIENMDLGRFSDRTKLLSCMLDSAGDFSQVSFSGWKDVFEDNDLFEDLMDKSLVVVKFLDLSNKRLAKSLHLVKYKGEIIPAINANTGSGILEEFIPNVYDKYKFVCKYYRLSLNAWKVSLYSKNDIDLPKFSNGEFRGHKGACGGIFEELPFEFVNEKIDFS